MYAKAETENFRKRSIDEMDKARKYAIETTCMWHVPCVTADKDAVGVRSAQHKKRYCVPGPYCLPLVPGPPMGPDPAQALSLVE